MLKKLISSDSDFGIQLIKWHDCYGRKNLPWQLNPNPYHTWISEIMLQQTQVETVIPYFNRFLSSFPNVVSLANASIEEVLQHWAGLGYYARARNLYKTANIIKNMYAGTIPNDYDALLSLPGIGKSTAGAILALGHKRFGVILDGNVKRVLSRYFGVFHDHNCAKGTQHYWKISTFATPKHRCDTYTQAIMDLGATVCLLNNTRCYQCPFQKKCYANRHELQPLLPFKKKKTIQKKHRKTFIFDIKNGKVGLNRIVGGGIWSGLLGPTIMDNEQHMPSNLNRIEKAYKHVFSHQIWYIDVYINDDETRFKSEAWYELSCVLDLELPKPVKSILEKIVHEKSILQEA